MPVRTSVAAVLVAAAGTLALGGMAHAQAEDHSCAEFRSQAQAQRALEAAHGGREAKWLDADLDGVACEVWFAGRNQGDRVESSAETGSTGSGSPSRAETARAGASATAEAGIGDPTGSVVPAGSVRQVFPVPRGGVDTGKTGPAGLVSPSFALVLAAFAAAGTSAAGAAAAARRPLGAPVRFRRGRAAAGSPARPEAAA